MMFVQRKEGTGYPRGQMTRIQEGVKCNEKIKFIQLNLNHCRVTRNLLEQAIHDSKVEVTIVSELYRNHHGG